MHGAIPRSIVKNKLVQARPPMTIIDRVFGKIYKIPCWGAVQGFSSILTLEFGRPELRIQGPIKSSSNSKRIRALFARRIVRLRGHWRLTIFGCNWKFFSADQKMADSKSTRL